MLSERKKKERGILIDGSLREVQGERAEKRDFVLMKSQPPRVLKKLEICPK